MATDPPDLHTILTGNPTSKLRKSSLGHEQSPNDRTRNGLDINREHGSIDLKVGGQLVNHLPTESPFSVEHFGDR